MNPVESTAYWLQYGDFGASEWCEALCIYKCLFQAFKKKQEVVDNCTFSQPELGATEFRQAKSG